MHHINACYDTIIRFLFSSSFLHSNVRKCKQTAHDASRPPLRRQQPGVGSEMSFFVSVETTKICFSVDKVDCTFWCVHFTPSIYMANAFLIIVSIICPSFNAKSQSQFWRSSQKEAGNFAFASAMLWGVVARSSASLPRATYWRLSLKNADQFKEKSGNSNRRYVRTK